MKINEILIEAREAPLYHFTSENKFFKILSTDVLRAPQGRIYFTRDYGRQFLPANIGIGTWGFRVDQDMLRRRFGKQLKPGGQIQMSEKERQAWLADPKNQEVIDRFKQGGIRKGQKVVHGGVDVAAAVSGTTGMGARWESEEHLDVREVPNFHEYLTGLVYAGGNMERGLLGGGTDTDYEKRSTKPKESIELLATLLISHFGKNFELRDKLIEYMTKFNVPFVFQRQEFSAKDVKSKIIEIYRGRKREREDRERIRDWEFYADREGRKKVTVKAAYQHDARKIAMTAQKDQFPEGIWGWKDPDTGYTTWYNTPLTGDHMWFDIDRERSTDPNVKAKA